MSASGVSSRALRIAVAGATGTLGRELLDVLGGERLPIAELIPLATDASLGAEVDFAGESWPVVADPPLLKGLDALVLCTPAAASLELARQALRAEVPCFDGSGAFLSTREVVLGIAGLVGAAALHSAPLLSAPPGSPLAWARLIHAAAGEDELVDVSAMLATSAGDLGRSGIEALSNQTIALLNQTNEEAEEPDERLRGLAFDCRPVGGDDPAAGLMGVVLERLRGIPVATDAIRVRVPTFVGEGATLRLSFAHEPDLEAMTKRLEAAPGVDLWAHGETPSTRDTAGRDDVLVSPPRLAGGKGDGGHAAVIWAAADPVRVAARNLVDLLRARLVMAPTV